MWKNVQTDKRGIVDGDLKRYAMQDQGSFQGEQLFVFDPSVVACLSIVVNTIHPQTKQPTYIHQNFWKD